ncbi:MAG: amidase [Alphaproteobacteria bacterium]|nr:amidase [Alphaproteobacteria bacterium]
MPSSTRDRLERRLDAIGRLDPQLRAFITPLPDQARAQADAVDAATRAGRSLGAAHGLIVAIKDCVDIGGVRGTAGSRFFEDRIAPRDSAVVARLRAAGAVLIGTTNLHEFCYGGTTQNAHWGACRNPWDPARIPGGSSGGSAVAVAAGMADAAIGTDTGGSIRGPAAINGIAGLRPSFGSVPATGTFPVSPPLDVPGPMARRALDLALIFAAIAGPDADDPLGDPHAPSEPLRSIGAGIAGLRIGIPRNHYFTDAPADIVAPVMAAARTLERLGARLRDVDVPGAEDAPANVQRLIFADAANLHRERLATAPELFDPLVRQRLQPGLELRGVDYAAALRWREGFRHGVDRLLATEATLVVSPAVATHVPRADDQRNVIAVTAAITKNSWGWAAAGVPAIAIPCGFSADGMPVGLQLAGPRRRDEIVLRAAFAYQQATDFHELLPPLHA